MMNPQTNTKAQSSKVQDVQQTIGVSISPGKRISLRSQCMDGQNAITYESFTEFMVRFTASIPS